MRSFRSYQILAAAALLLSGPYIAAAADPADQAQWSESVPLVDFPLKRSRRAHRGIYCRWLAARPPPRPKRQPPLALHSLRSRSEPTSYPRTLRRRRRSAPRQRRMYFVRDTFWGTTLAAHRQQLAPEAFASLDTTVRQNGFDQKQVGLQPAAHPLWINRLQEIPPENVRQR